MKFNLKMFRNVLPKKSVLKKNKWVLVILALVILVGLYWYSKKSQENYYNSKAEGPWGGDKTLKPGDQGLRRLDTLTGVDKTNLLRFATHISGIRDTFYKIEKENGGVGAQETNVNYCFIERKKGTSSMGMGVINLNDYGSFIDSAQILRDPSSVWRLVDNGGTLGPKRPDEEPKCSDLYSKLFTNHQQGIMNELAAVDAENIQAGIDEEDEPEYINEIIHEQVNLYLGDTECNASNNFLTKIWTDTNYINANNDPVKGEDLRQTILDEFPGIELDDKSRPALVKTGEYAMFGEMMPQDVIRCEHIVDGEEDRSATDNLEICKLAGFYAVPTDKKLSFPLIQYSFLGKTNKDSSDEGYTRYTVNFDPTKKLVPDDDNGKKMVDEDVVDGVTKPVYTSQKIIDWLSDLRGN